jgi:sulfur carrier protein ThiS
MTLPTGSTLGDLLRTLDIAPKGDAVLLVVNGRQAQATQVLGDGDEVNLIPALSGGAPTSDGQFHPARAT